MSAARQANDDDSIDAYLDALLLELRGRSTDVRRVLLEAEDHLRDGVADGATAAEAIARFGSPRVVARRFDPTVAPVVPDLVRLAWCLAAIGCIAIGLSGLLTVAMRTAFGDAFVAGDPVGVTYTPARCADFVEYHPDAGSCNAAASAHHADEVEQYRIAAGVVGAIGLAIWWWRLRRPSARLPVELGPTITATVFGTVGVALLAQGLAMLAEGAHHGAGQWLSAAIVSLAVSAFSGARLLRQLRVRSAITARA